LDLDVLASPQSRAVLGVLPVRLRSVRSLGFAKTPISCAQNDMGVASLAAESSPANLAAQLPNHISFSQQRMGHHTR